MPVLVTGIHVFFCRREHVDGRNKSGHDANGESACGWRLSGAVPNANRTAVDGRDKPPDQVRARP